jgi:hypothetical protein
LLDYADRWDDQIKFGEAIAFGLSPGYELLWATAAWIKIGKRIGDKNRGQANYTSVY